ncbi:sugar transporter ERD6-like protein 7 [Tanacetum coccineum]
MVNDACKDSFKRFTDEPTQVCPPPSEDVNNEKEKQEVKNLAEPTAKRQSRITPCLKNFRVVCKESSFHSNKTPQVSSVFAITSTLPSIEPKDSLIMGEDYRSTFSTEEIVLIPRESKETSRSDSKNVLPSYDDFSSIKIPHDNFVTFSNPLFEFDVNFNNLLFDEELEDIKCKDSYDSNLDESTFLVTPLSDSNKYESLILRDDIELLLHEDQSTPLKSVDSILEGFINDPLYEENEFETNDEAECFNPGGENSCSSESLFTTRKLSSSRQVARLQKGSITKTVRILTKDVELCSKVMERDIWENQKRKTCCEIREQMAYLELTKRIRAEEWYQKIEEDKRREEWYQKIEDDKRQRPCYLKPAKNPIQNSPCYDDLTSDQNKKITEKGVGKEGFGCALNKSKGSHLGLRHCAANRKRKKRKGPFVWSKSKSRAVIEVGQTEAIEGGLKCDNRLANYEQPCQHFLMFDYDPQEGELQVKTWDPEITWLKILKEHLEDKLEYGKLRLMPSRRVLGLEVTLEGMRSGPSLREVVEEKSLLEKDVKKFNHMIEQLQDQEAKVDKQMEEKEKQLRVKVEEWNMICAENEELKKEAVERNIGEAAIERNKWSESVDVMLLSGRKWKGSSRCYHLECNHAEGFPADIGTIIYAVLQVIITALNALFVDNAGIKPLLLVSGARLVMGCLLAVISFYLKAYEIGLAAAPALAVTGILLYIASFSAGMGAVPWIIMSEIFPINIKGAAVSLATLTNWFGTWAVSFTSKFLLSWSSYGTFLLDAAINIAGILFIIVMVPETKGRTLEQIQAAINT